MDTDRRSPDLLQHHARNPNQRGALKARQLRTGKPYRAKFAKYLDLAETPNGFLPPPCPSPISTAPSLRTLGISCWREEDPERALRDVRIRVQAEWIDSNDGRVAQSPNRAAVYLAGFSAFLTLTLYPVLASAYYSFTEYRVATPPKWVGLRNYVELFSDHDYFLPSLANTVFMFIELPIALALAVGIALLLNQNPEREWRLFRTLFYLPSVVPHGSERHPLALAAESGIWSRKSGARSDGDWRGQDGSRTRSGQSRDLSS